MVETETTYEIALTLKPIEDERRHACDFCSTAEHEAVVAERGIVEAEYRMVNTYGVTFGYTCGMCIEGAPER